MRLSIGSFFGSHIKIGLLSIKGWQATMAAVIVITAVGAAGITVVRHNEERTVVVIINGINTGLTSCRYNGDKTSSAPFTRLKAVLAQDGFSDPYTQGCPNQPIPYLGGSLDIAEYSYADNPGHMVGEHWEPNDFNHCAPNTDSLDKEMVNLETLLDSYRVIYPNAHFILVGHSLGGLVALAGARYYATKHNGTVITKVITLDSPLHGRPVPIDSPVNAALAFGCPNPSSLGTLLNSTAESQIGLAEDLVSKLTQTGTSVYTLGNLDDCLYREAACMSTLESLGVPDDINTQFVANAFVREYHLGATGNWPEGHGSILTSDNALDEISWLVAHAPSVTANVMTSPGQDATLHIIASSPLGIKEARIKIIGAEFGSISADEQLTIKADGTTTMLDRTVALDTPQLPNGKLLAQVTAVVDGLGHTHLAQTGADTTAASIDLSRDLKAQAGFTNVNNGKSLPTPNAGQPSQATPVATSTPSLGQISVFVGGYYDGSLTALNAATGTPRWTYLLGSPGQVNATPEAVHNGIVYVLVNRFMQTGQSVGVETTTLYAFDTAVGKPLWHTESVSGYISGFLDLVDDTVYLQSQSNPTVVQVAALKTSPKTTPEVNSVVALDATTGQTKWNYLLGTDSLAGFAVDQGAVYIAHEGDSPASARLDLVWANSGTKLWSEPTGALPIDLLAANGVAYAATCEGENNLNLNACSAVHVQAFDGVSGKILWHYDAQAGGIGLQVAGGQVYITTGVSGYPPFDTFQVRDAQTGVLKWASPANCGSASVWATSDVAYVTCGADGNATVSAFDPGTGIARWKVTPATNESPTALEVSNVVGGVVYVQVDTAASSPGCLFPFDALDAATGAMLWSHTGCYIVGGQGLALLATVYTAFESVEADNLTAVKSSSGVQLWQTSDPVTGFVIG